MGEFDRSIMYYSFGCFRATFTSILSPIIDFCDQITLRAYNDDLNLFLSNLDDY